ncbi:MAG: glycosyltransferase family 1 protein [Candidatus Buchananbacteria bacterium]|nr:glycosyltransferase family 1 protein [Candidatus Buchananbacteria bacterium]
MRIGIDARLYGARHGGLGRYSENLIKQLEKIDSKNQYFIFLAQNNFNDYQPQSKNFKKVLADFRAYSLGEQIFFPRLLKKYQLDLMHFTHFNAPVFYRRPFIVTIHDLIISHYPHSRATTLNPIMYKIKLFFYRLVVNNTAKRAKKIITVSDCSKKDIIKLLKINPSKISVTYEGVGLPQDGQADCARLKSDLGIKKDFLLYVGSAYPHKNLEKLLQAFKSLNRDIQLVLVGQKNYFYERLEQTAQTLSLSGRVIFTGYLDDEKLSCLYKTAALYVFPSLIEGFGLPPLEAQSYGLPVLSSSASCLPEILGDSVVYFNPENETEIAKSISNTLDNQELLQALKIKGQANLKKYSWEKCALETLGQYES